MAYNKDDSKIISHQLPLFLFFFISATFLLFIFLSTKIVYSFQVKLAWDANTESDLAGYYLYYKSDPNTLYADQNRITINDPNITTCTVPGLNDLKTYYFVLTAYDTCGLESANSNEVPCDPSDNNSDPSPPLPPEPIPEPTPVPPIAHNDTIPIMEDTTANGILSASYNEIYKNSLYYFLTSNAAHGTVTITNSFTGEYFYKPNLNFFGLDSFTFKVNDSRMDSNEATITINITAINDAPEASNANLTTEENTILIDTLMAKDVDSDTLYYAIVTNCNKGTAAITDSSTGAFIYTPDVNVTGTDTFTFKVNDSQLDSNTATITVTIAPAPLINNAPVAEDGNLTTVQKTTAKGILIAKDANGDELYFSLVSLSQKGKTTITDPTTGAYLYRPKPNAIGEDSFTFKANDGRLDSNAATVTITITNPITPLNNAPIAYNGILTVLKDTEAGGTLSASDKDGDTLFFSLVTNGSKGTAVITNTTTGAYIYAPNAAITGIDTFTFKANDGRLDSNTATVTIANPDTPLNNAPVAYNGTLTVTEDNTTGGFLSASDIDGDTLIYTLTSRSIKGKTTIINAATGEYIYRPKPNATGIDTFTFKVNDGVLDSNTATIIVTINPVNDSPFADNGILTAMEDITVSGILSASDADGDTLRYSLVSSGSEGTATILNETTGTYTYSPNPDATDMDILTFHVNDGHEDSNEATIVITIKPNNSIVYEDAEDGSIQRWSIHDKFPSGAQISNTFDEQRQSRVIDFQGYGIQNSYRLGDFKGKAWHNKTQYIVQWSMNYSEYYEISLDILTNEGQDYLHYAPIPYNKLENEQDICFGIGEGAIEGQWHTFTRDLQTDLQKALSGATILEVNGFLVRGNVKVDDIKLMDHLPGIDLDGDGISDDDETNIYSTDPGKVDTDEDGINDGYEVHYWGVNTFTDYYETSVNYLLNNDSDSDGVVDGIEIKLNYNPLNPFSTPSSEDYITTYEDAEDGTIQGWSIKARLRSPCRTMIHNVFDDDRQSRVIQLKGDVPFCLENYDLSDWHNSSQFVAEWSMNYSREFILSFSVYTTSGNRHVHYTPVDYDKFGDDSIYYGLGTGSMDGQWHTFIRDLQADLEEAQPGVKILEVNNFQIQGGGMVDDIKLRYNFPAENQ